MEDFHFPDGCTFCFSRIGSTKCLLPYFFVMSYISPTDGLSKSIDLTEIHTTYGTIKLRENFELNHWVRTRPTSAEIQSYAGSILSERDSENEHHSSTSIPSIIEATNDVSNSIRNPMTTIRETTSPEPEVSIQLDTSIGETSQDATPSSFAEALQGVNLNQLHDPRDYYSPDQDSSRKGKAPVKSGGHEFVEIDRNDENHLIQDLLMAIKTAFNMHNNNRSRITVVDLNESILYELTLLKSKGRSYIPSKDTKLDGQIALSKEIAANHSLHQLHNHVHGYNDNTRKFCLLNYPPMEYDTEVTYTTKLEATLIKYFNSIVNEPKIPLDQKNHILEAIKFELERQDYPLAYKWIKNQTKILKMQLAKLTASIKPNASTNQRLSSPESPKQFTRKREPYPSLDQNLLDFIDSHLMMHVKSAINHHPDRLPIMSDETKVDKFLLTLATEFLKRNKGWQNENSFTAASHLSKLEESTGLKTKSSESILTFKLLKVILDDFRSSYKAKKT